MARIESAALAAAVVLGAIAAAVTAARGPSAWLALPAFLGVAALVLGVQAALSAWPRRDSEVVPAAGAEPDNPTSTARTLVSHVCHTVGDIRSLAITAPELDRVAAAAGRVVKSVYRLACLVARADVDRAKVLAQLALAVKRLENVAGRVNDPAEDPASLLSDLTGLCAHLDSVYPER